jgi:prepilin-type N-terminal cleavage/methylation domain-containing protein
MPTRQARRPAFTLIELLVVIGVIALIAALAVMIGPALEKSERSARGASLLQGHLFIAKQQALRDRVPQGIRLLVEGNQVRRLQYIQQPFDFRQGSIQAFPDANQPQPVAPNTQTGQRLFAILPATIDPTGGLTDPSLWPVQPGDFLQIETRAVYRIEQVTAPAGGQPGTILIARDRPPLNPALSGPTNQYWIQRAPRPVSGEDIIDLPEDIVIDLTLSEMTLESGYLDILFSPSGRILGNAGASGRIVLWVRDATADPATSTEQSLVVINTRTGLIASVPVDVGGANPKSFVDDPKSFGGL